jgi:hypothetical protein
MVCTLRSLGSDWQSLKNLREKSIRVKSDFGKRSFVEHDTGVHTVGLSIKKKSSVND